MRKLYEADFGKPENYAFAYGLTRGTCFVERRLEIVAVAGLLWISWCVLDAEVYFCVFFFRFVFFFERTHSTCCKYESPLPHIPLYYYCRDWKVEYAYNIFEVSTSKLPPFLMRQGGRSEAIEAVCCLYAKTASSYRRTYRVPFFNLSICLSVCLPV